MYIREIYHFFQNYKRFILETFSFFLFLPLILEIVHLFYSKSGKYSLIFIALFSSHCCCCCLFAPSIRIVGNVSSHNTLISFNWVGNRLKLSRKKNQMEMNLSVIFTAPLFSLNSLDLADVYLTSIISFTIEKAFAITIYSQINMYDLHLSHFFFINVYGNEYLIE